MLDQLMGDRVRRDVGVPWTGPYPHPTLVMGIVNVTPDSFQPEGRFLDHDAAVQHGLRLVGEGADILDVGGESTRPGSSMVSGAEEMDRVVPVIRALTSACDVPVSVDTRKAEVADAALHAGAHIVNDISAGRHDERMLGVAARHNAFVCLMHAPLDIASMKWSPDEEGMGAGIMPTLTRFLTERARAAESAGVRADRIWIDPGFGFGKSVEENVLILHCLDQLTALEWPVLLGTSRKSTLGALLGGAAPEHRVEATIATVALAIQSGVAILRVHDVEAVFRASRVADAIVHHNFRR